MKSYSNILLLVLSAVNARPDQSALATGHRLYETSSTQNVQGVFKEWGLETGSGSWGLVFQLGYDLAFGYSGEVRSFQDNGWTYLALNPMAFFEAFGEFRVKLATGFFKGDLIFDMKPFRYTFADYQAALNIERPEDYCWSLSQSQDVGDLDVRIVT